MTQRAVMGPLELAVPAAWTRTDELTFVAEPRSFSGVPSLSEIRGLRQNVNVQFVESSATLEDVVNTYRQELHAGALVQLHTLAQRDRTVGHTYSAFEHVFTFEEPHLGIAVQSAQVLFIAENIRFMFTFTSLPGFFEKDRQQFDEVLDSIHIHAEVA